MTDKDKAERLAAALRDNLKRRKAQARELGCNAPAQGGTRVPAGAEKKD